MVILEILKVTVWILAILCKLQGSKFTIVNISSSQNFQTGNFEALNSPKLISRKIIQMGNFEFLNLPQLISRKI